MSPTPVRSAAESAGVKADILAAGALCWRFREGALEVLLVHRPKYRDWSWPKGKADPGETLPEAAVREVEEETGQRITLGRPLPSADYTVGKKLRKHVAYWAAEVTSPRPERAADLKEIDRVQWMGVKKAYRSLTRYDDREQLDALLDAHRNGGLRTVPLIIVRHGKAFPRSKWHETEARRPLLALGSRQAKALTGMLAAWRPTRLISSPWKRCSATIAPYAATMGYGVKYKARISEKGANANPKRAAQVIERVLESRRATAVCSHRPVLPVLFAAMGEAAPKRVAGQLPVDDPYLSPGEILVASVRLDPVPRIVAIERHRPIDS